MQEIYQSIILVTSASLFWWYMSTILSLGMVIGAKYDDRFRGFRRSLALITPYTVIIFLTNFSRLYETSLSNHLTANSYNGMVSLVFITVFYVIGLFIGHMIDRKGKEKANEGHTSNN